MQVCITISYLLYLQNISIQQLMHAIRYINTKDNTKCKMCYIQNTNFSGKPSYDHTKDNKNEATTRHNMYYIVKTSYIFLPCFITLCSAILTPFLSFPMFFPNNTGTMFVLCTVILYC